MANLLMIIYKIKRVEQMLSKKNETGKMLMGVGLMIFIFSVVLQHLFPKPHHFFTAKKKGSQS